MTFFSWIHENFDHDELIDIANFGADGGGHALTYPDDIRKCFERFSDEIGIYLEDKSLHAYVTVSQFIGGFDSLNELYQALVWTALKCAAVDYRDELQNEDVA